MLYGVQLVLLGSGCLSLANLFGEHQIRVAAFDLWQEQSENCRLGRAVSAIYDRKITKNEVPAPTTQHPKNT